MAKVYAVWFDNCEAYEDNYMTVISVHTTYEGAIHKITSIIKEAKQTNSLVQLDKIPSCFYNGVAWNLTLKDEDDWIFEEAYSIQEYELEA